MDCILMGIGNELLGDDGVGPYIAQSLKGPDLLALDCGTVPENFTSLVKKYQPKQLIIVDAAELGLPPGEYRRLPLEEADTMFSSTHTIPISALISYLEEWCGEIILIGIQPKSLQLGQGLSREVQAGAEQLLALLKNGAIETIGAYG